MERAMLGITRRDRNRKLRNEWVRQKTEVDDIIMRPP
jgi:hypothetical protein